ncbi:hypothetical protein L484_025244 [Morus notabilis]|uniref:Uncharacterized protein n=1 Tax=Morus notabilis TaxID=981085 RepID=W9S4V0_9ROSA|nr:hypothetical protein L484_025244 [Morus notabilis]
MSSQIILERKFQWRGFLPPSRQPSRRPTPAKTAQLTQPYRDHANEGSLSIFTKFSPMADPSFQPGRVVD